MTTLHCDVTSCANHDQGYCCLSGIQVSGDHACDCADTCCSSFQTKSGAAQNTTRHDIPNECSQIACSACSCHYNQSGACSADKVMVEGGSASQCAQTKCGTFVHK